MWFNSMQREEPYLVLTSTEVFRDENVPSGTVRQVLHGCRLFSICRRRQQQTYDKRRSRIQSVWNFSPRGLSSRS